MVYRPCIALSVLTPTVGCKIILLYFDRVTVASNVYIVASKSYHRK